MKINIANPSTGASKTFEIDDEKKYRIFFDKKISDQVSLDPLGGDFVGYIARISGGLDKQGFAMMQGVLTANRVRLLLKGGQNGFYRNRRHGDRRRKSIRGCIVSQAISALNLILVKKGPAELPGVTDRTFPNRLGPKRVGKIRKFFSLSKDEDVRNYVAKVQTFGKKDPTKFTKLRIPKIQRLVTGKRIRRKRALIKQIRERKVRSSEARANYRNVLLKIRAEKKSANAKS